MPEIKIITSDTSDFHLESKKSSCFLAVKAAQDRFALKYLQTERTGWNVNNSNMWHDYQYNVLH